MIKKDFLIIFFLILISSFFRFYNLEKRAVFFADEERDAYVVYKTIIKDRHLTLIGPSTSVGNIYLGPAWYYWLLPWYLLFNGDPIASPISAATVGVITTVLFYLLGREIFDKRVGFLSAIIYGCWHYLINLSSRAWNPSLIPLFSLIFVYSLFKLKNGEIKYWWLIVVCIGLGIQFHLTASLFIPVLIIFLIIKKIKISSKFLFLGFLLFLILVLPLILFDLRHNFWNTRAFLIFIKNLLAGANFGSQRIVINPYYFLIFLPVIIYLISFLLLKFLKFNTIIFWPQIVCVIFILVNLFLVLKDNKDYSLFYKKQAVKYVVNEVKNEKFKVIVFGPEDYKYGIRYLFYYFGKEPEESPVDQDYLHLYQAKKRKPSRVVYLSYNNNSKINNYCSIREIKTFGRIKVCLSD